MRGDDVRTWREARSLSQRRLAVLLDVDQVTIGRWERGERRPPGRMLELALWALDRQLAEEGGQSS
jgi:transcriptional regulator with XRE-family HTH domain